MLKERTVRSLPVLDSCCLCEESRDPPGEQKPRRRTFTSQELLKDGTIILCPFFFLSRKATAAQAGLIPPTPWPLFHKDRWRKLNRALWQQAQMTQDGDCLPRSNQKCSSTKSSLSKGLQFPFTQVFAFSPAKPWDRESKVPSAC